MQLMVFVTLEENPLPNQVFGRNYKSHLAFIDALQFAQFFFLLPHDSNMILNHSRNAENQQLLNLIKTKAIKP